MCSFDHALADKLPCCGVCVMVLMSIVPIDCAWHTSVDHQLVGWKFGFVKFLLFLVSSLKRKLESKVVQSCKTWFWIHTLFSI